MASKQPSIIGHLIMWMVFSFAIEAFVVPAIVKPGHEQDLINVEMRIDSAFLGEAHQEIMNKATSSFRHMFVNTGAVAWSVDFFGRPATEHIFGTENSYAAFSNKWVTSFWYGVYLFLYRMYTVLYWFVPSSLFIGAAAVDGFATWRIKKLEFGVADPIKFRLASHSISHSIGIVIFLGFFPFPIPPIVWPAAVAIVASTIWLTVSNFQSGLAGVEI